MRQIAHLLLPLAALMPQPALAQSIGYDFGFDAPAPARPVDPDMRIRAQAVGVAGAQDQGGERVLGVARPRTALGVAYGPFRVLDASQAALVGVTDEGSLAAFEAMMRDHPGISMLQMIDCPGTENDRANLQLGRMIRARGIATHVPADGFVGSGAVELYLAGVRRSAEAGAEFAVHSWEDYSGREPVDYAADAPQNRTYIDYYRGLGMSEAEARSFYAMTNSVPFSQARWLSAGEMGRWASLADPARTAPAQFAQAKPMPLPAAARPRAVRYGPFRIVDGSSAEMVGATDASTPAAFDAMVRDYPGIATLVMVDCPGTEDDRANLRLGRQIRAKGIATHVPANGWVASGAVELFLAGTRRSADPSARFAVHSWEDDTGRGPRDYAMNAPKNRAYLDYYRTMGMSEHEARGFYAMTNSVPFSSPRSLTTEDIARWTRLDRPTPAPWGTTLAQAAPGPVGG